MARFIMDLVSFSGLLILIYLPIRIIYLLFKKKSVFSWKELFTLTYVFYMFSLIFIVWVKNNLHTNYLLYNFIPFKTIVNYFMFDSF